MTNLYVRTLETFAVLLLAVVGAVLGMAAYSWWANMHIFQLNQPIQVLESQIHAGQMLTISIDYCKSERFNSRLAEVHYSLTNTATNLVYPMLNVEVVAMEPGCHVAQEVLPTPQVIPGSYYLQMIRIYNGAFGTQAPIISQSKPFEVVQ